MPAARHTREKIVAAAAERFVVIADSSKTVDAIAAPIPVELLEFGLAATLSALGSVAIRDGAPRSPDGGIIADYFGEVGDLIMTAGLLAATPGVVDHGLFAPGLVSEVLVGQGNSVETIEIRVRGRWFGSVRNGPRRSVEIQCPTVGLRSPTATQSRALSLAH